MIKLNAKELRNYEKKQGDQGNKRDQKRKNHIYIILDNVLDTYNIGSIFRLADAVGAKKLIITGQAEVPPNTRIKKASINTTEWVEWEYKDTVLKALRELKKKEPKLKVIAIEQKKGSVPYAKANYDFPLALVVGNETYGVSKEVLEMCDQVVELPMFGVNISLNVMVSLGVVLYKIMEMRKNQDF